MRLGGMTFAVEFRNASWLNEKNAERTLGFLEDKGLAFVVVDEPQGFKSTSAGHGGDLAIWPWSASTAAHATPGRPRASRRSSASATSTPRRARGMGAADPGGGERRRRTLMS